MRIYTENYSTWTIQQSVQRIVTVDIQNVTYSILKHVFETGWNENAIATYFNWIPYTVAHECNTVYIQ